MTIIGHILLSSLEADIGKLGKMVLFGGVQGILVLGKARIDTV